MTTSTLRRFAVLPALFLAAAVTTACDDDDPTTTNDALVGNFAATEAMFTANDDPNNQFDVIQEDGSFDIDFRSDGTFRSDLALPGRESVVRTGTFEVDGSTVALTEGGITRNATFSRTGSDLILTDPTHGFAFDGQTTTEARLDARLSPQLE